MCWRHERTRGVSLVFMIVLVVWAVWAETCEDLQCQNSNPCQTTVHPGDNRTQARCVCTGRWAGARCQHPIRLKPQSVTSSQARLTVEVVTSGPQDLARSPGSSALSLVSRGEREGVRLNYTLVYWRRNDTLTSLALDTSFATSGEVSCVLLHHRDSRRPVLWGLTPSTRYTICVESGYVDSCVLASFTDAAASSSSSLSLVWPSNCVTIYTPNASSPAPFPFTRASTVSWVAMVSVFILAVLVVIFAVFLLRRHNTAFRLVLDSACRRLCCCCCTCCSAACCGNDASSSDGGSQDRSRLSHVSTSQRPRSVFLEDSPRPKRSPRKSFFKKPFQKRPKSSTYTSANMLLGPPPPSSRITHEAFAGGAETSPLGFELEEDDAVFENSPPGQANATAALPLPTLRSKPRHKLSRKRRGYVTYSTRKDKNIRLTTVLESTTGDEDEELEGDVLGCARSSI